MLNYWLLYTINDWLDWTTSNWLAFEWAPGGSDANPFDKNLIRPNERPMVRPMVRLMVGDGPRP